MIRCMYKNEEGKCDLSCESPGQGHLDTADDTTCISVEETSRDYYEEEDVTTDMEGAYHG